MDYFAPLYKIYFLDLSFVRIIRLEKNHVLFVLGRFKNKRIKLNNKICV